MTMPEAAQSPTDHRSRSAALRREQMRQRLVESAVVVIASRGFEAALIEQVVSHAGVSRGTFYKYFPSSQALVAAASQQLAQELLVWIMAQLHNLDDPAAQAAAGCALYLETICTYPMLARFILVHCTSMAQSHKLIDAQMQVALQRGIDQGRFTQTNAGVLADLLAGPLLKAVERSVAEGLDPSYRRDMVAGLLQAIGVARAEAQVLAALAPPALTLPRDSLLWRSTMQGGGPREAVSPAASAWVPSSQADTAQAPTSRADAVSLGFSSDLKGV